MKAAQPDWVILRSVGVMTPTALKEAAQVGFPRDKIVGLSPTCLEQDMVSDGEVGTVYWIRGMLRGLLTAEALRTAMREFGHQPLTGAQVQWGLDHLTLTAASLREMGAEGLLALFTLSCRDHEGGRNVKFQQWDGKQWTIITDWIAPDQALVRPLVEEVAAKCAQEKGITPRDCP